MTLLEEPCNLLRLPPVHIGEKLDPHEGCDGIARRRSGRLFHARRFARGNGAALQQIERAILDGPFDIAPRAVYLLALECELAQEGELRIAKAELAHLPGRNRLFERSAGRQRADGNALASGL